MQQLSILNDLAWLTAVYQNSSFPVVMAGIFILFLLTLFTILIFRSRDQNDF